MTRIWNTSVFILATIYFVVDEVFSYAIRPLTVWLTKKKLFERARRWVTSLAPYPSLALFAVPVIILKPAKPLTAYLLGTGHFFAGAVVFITAEVLKLTFVERLFHLNRDKLLSIPAFAWDTGTGAAHDGCARIAGSLAGLSEAAGQRQEYSSDTLATIQRRPSTFPTRYRSVRR